ncbi:MAG: TolC family protein [Candidatus Cloacimonetes bacterium]|nr:TolC family protein [Candidatus Cloacimonadota bacterium]
MKKILFSLLAIAMAFSLWSLSLQECLQNLRQTTPLKGNIANIEGQKKLKDKSLTAGYYPSLSVVGDLGYNSEVTSLNTGSAMPISLPEPDKDRESLGLELKQMVWDSGATQLMKQMNNLESQAKTWEVSAAMDSREMEAVSLYYSVISLTEALAITELQTGSLNSRLEQVKSAYQNGIREASDVQLVSYDLLSNSDRVNSLQKSKQAALDKLARLCGMELSSDVELSIPDLLLPETEEFNRAELRRLETLIALQQTNSRLAKRKNYPQVYARAMAGLGKPGYNMFSTDLHDYYSIGLSLSWKIWDFGQGLQESRIAMNEAAIMEANKANLLLSLQNELSGLDAELESVDNNIASSRQKVELLEKIVQAYEGKYSSGIITTTELLIQTNNLLSAKLELQSSVTKLSALQAKKLLLLGGKI